MRRLRQEDPARRLRLVHRAVGYGDREWHEAARAHLSHVRPTTALAEGEQVNTEILTRREGMRMLEKLVYSLPEGMEMDAVMDAKNIEELVGIANGVTPLGMLPDMTDNLRVSAFVRLIKLRADVRIVRG